MRQRPTKIIYSFFFVVFVFRREPNEFCILKCTYVHTRKMKTENKKKLIQKIIGKRNERKS